MPDPHSNRPNVLALNAETGNRVGKGQDNLVHELNLPEYAEALQATGNWVVKVSHQGKNAQHKRNFNLDPVEAAISGTTYKQRKYGMLREFLGPMIPESLFLTSTVEADGKLRPAEITLQQRVPNVTLDKLTESQKDDPRLQDNLHGLFNKLRYMYSVVGEANARSAQGAAIDAKLDLGGISDFAASKSLDQQFTSAEISKAAHKVHSPNLLVDPDSMNLYCIDYDQGDWNEGMGATMDLASEIDQSRRKVAAEVSHMALSGLITRGYSVIEPPVQKAPDQQLTLGY